MVGNLGTGNVERRLGEAARTVHETGSWTRALTALRDLNPERDEFQSQLAKRSYNKATLQFLRRSIIQETKTPEPLGYEHAIRPRRAENWTGFNEDDVAYWGSTIGNTLLTRAPRRPVGALTWRGVKEHLLPEAVDGEWTEAIADYRRWDVEAVTEIGRQLALSASEIWF